MVGKSIGACLLFLVFMPSSLAASNDPARWTNISTLYASNSVLNRVSVLARCSGLFHMVAQQHSLAKCQKLVSSSNTQGLAFFKSAIDLEWASAAYETTRQGIELDQLNVASVLQKDIHGLIRRYSDIYLVKMNSEYSQSGELISDEPFMTNEMIKCSKIAADFKDYPSKHLHIQVQVK